MSGSRRLLSRRAVFCGTAGLGLALALPRNAGAAVGPFPDPGELFYELRFAGVAIGTQRQLVTRADDQLTVMTEIDLTGGLRSDPTYRFSHRSEEFWWDGMLQRFSSQSRDTRNEWFVEAARRGEALRGLRSGHEFAAAGFLVTTHCWLKDAVHQTALFDAVYGWLRQVRSNSYGAEFVTLDGKQVETQRFTLFGELRRELWYDSSHTLVKALMPNVENDWIEQILIGRDSI